MLEIGSRTDIPIGIGIPFENTANLQAAWVEGYDLSSYPGPVHKDGVGAIVDTIMSSREPITLVGIGPLPNVSAALKREPRIAERTRFVGMHGSIRRGYDGSEEPVAEYNVACDPQACREVFAAPWDVTITPLDTCGVVRLTGEKYRAVCDFDDPLIQAVIENYQIWIKNAEWVQGLDPTTESSILFDTVAVYLAFSEELLEMKQLGIRVTDQGYTVVDDDAKSVNCAMDWKNLSAFEDLLVERLTE
jgi:inosine-uridine nucleoside N-ribohydrolase